jgi:hypothetical protein
MHEFENEFKKENIQFSHQSIDYTFSGKLTSISFSNFFRKIYLSFKRYLIELFLVMQKFF